MTTTLNESFSQLRSSSVDIVIEEEAEKGIHLRNAKFTVRRIHMTIFCITMFVIAFDTGYSVQINDNTANLLLKDLFHRESDSKLGKAAFFLVFYVGCMIGCVWGGKHVSYGRRRALIFSSAFLTGIYLFLMIQNFYVFLTGRFLIGFGVGIRLVAFLRMVEEYCPQNWFSMLSHTVYAFLALGAVSSAVFPIEKETSVGKWRWTFG